MLKRLAAVAALSLLPALATAAPAEAARSCNITVPSKVTITSPYKAVKGTYSSGCRAYAEDAYWNVTHPTQGVQEMFWFAPGMTSETLDWYDWNPMGTYTVRGQGAYDADYDRMTQNSPKMAVKVGSRLSVSSARSGRYVTVKGTTTRYLPSWGSYRPWAGTRITLQQKTCSSCSWKTVKTGTTNRYGKVSLKTYAGTTRYWRISTKDTSTTWGRTSSTVRR